MKMSELLVDGEREMKPLMLMAGLALSLSVAGYVFSQIRSRQPATDCCRSLAFASDESPRGREGCVGLKYELHFMKLEGNSPKFSGNKVTLLPNSDSRPSQTSTNVEDEDDPGFNMLAHEEFQMREKEPVPEVSHASTPTTENNDNSEIEEETTNLRKLVKALQERERKLELQLLHYYGRKEQDEVVKELESRVKKSTMEAKLFTSRIESLLTENQRLEAQLSDHSRVMAELESTEGNIKILKRKLISDASQEEKMIALQERTAALKDNEHVEGKHSEGMEKSLKRLRDLELDTIDLQKENFKLVEANMELSKKLESNQVVGSTFIHTSEVNDAFGKDNYLMKRTEELSKELEQLRLDRGSDVEEVAYLRRMNDSLRYELRNHQPTGGKTVARDVGKTLNLSSEEKAKELIAEYADMGHNERILLDLDSDHWSSSQVSAMTEKGDPDDSSTSIKNSSSSSKIKLFRKLKKLVLGKDTPSKRFSSSASTPTSYLNSRRMSYFSNCSFDNAMESCSHNGCISPSVPIDHASVKHIRRNAEISSQDQCKTSRRKASLDNQKLKKLTSAEARGARVDRCRSDLGSMVAYKRLVLGKQNFVDSPASKQVGDHESFESSEKLELKKFAGILKSNRLSRRTHRPSTSYNNT